MNQSPEPETWIAHSVLAQNADQGDNGPVRTITQTPPEITEFGGHGLANERCSRIPKVRESALRGVDSAYEVC
jgi:hypothetical protein